MEVDAKHLDLRLGRNAGGSLLDDLGEFEKAYRRVEGSQIVIITDGHET